MRGNGKVMLEMDEDLRDTQIKTATMETLKLERHMEKVCTHGIMEKFMMENGIKVLSMAMEFGEESKVILI